MATVITLNPPVTVPPARRAINPWVIAACVVVPTFMEVLDTTIANVALRYIAGGLSAAVTDSEWVITSYLAANATILPISGWLSSRLGRRNYFLGSIAVFTIASGLCGSATSLEELIFYRILQGLAGGGLQPSSQAVLLDSFPPEKQGSAMTLFGMAALIAPIIGPTLGGYLTVNYDWRWIFFINLPIGCGAFIAAFYVLEDPEYLKTQRSELLKKGWNLDFIGLGLLALAISSWEVLLSKGQEWDWFGDPYWRVQVLVACFFLGGGVMIWRQLVIQEPLINLKPLKDVNFVVCCIICFCAYAVLYGASTTLPGMLQALYGYDAFASGLVMSPSGIFAVITILITGAIFSRGFDSRWFIAGGLVLMAIGSYWMSMMTLDISPFQVIWPRIVLITGLSMMFAPLNVAAYRYIPRDLRASAVGIFALLRNEGGSVGTSIAQTMEIRREQFHTWRMGEFLDPLNPAVTEFLNQTTAYFQSLTSDPVMARSMALQAMADTRQIQAASLAYYDDFYLFAVIAICLLFLLLFVKRSAPGKGAHVSAE